MRWALIVVFSLAALGAWGLGFQTSQELVERADGMPLPRVAMRPLPELGRGVTVAKADVPAAPAKGSETTPVAAPTPAPSPVAAAVEKPPEKKEPPRPAPRPAAAAPRPTAEEATPAPAPRPAAAAKPAGEDAPAAAAPAGSGEGQLNLKASDTAEIVIDGRKIGPSPKLGFKVKSGKHKIRFDCYDENGNLKAGRIQTVDVAPDADVEVNYDCPFTQ